MFEKRPSEFAKYSPVLSYVHQIFPIVFSNTVTVGAPVLYESWPFAWVPQLTVSVVATK